VTDRRSFSSHLSADEHYAQLGCESADHSQEIWNIQASRGPRCSDSYVVGPEGWTEAGRHSLRSNPRLGQPNNHPSNCTTCGAGVIQCAPAAQMYDDPSREVVRGTHFPSGICPSPNLWAS
jgi:hypothetical protein